MANIFYFPQMSMYDKRTNKLTPEADGNINMMRNTIREWLKHRKDDHFYILLPDELKDFTLYDSRVTIKYYSSYVVSARFTRFNFPLRDIMHFLVDINATIDILINDVIELTTNFKALFESLEVYFEKIPKFISNIRHLDDDINYKYMFRLIDGIYNSDLVTILSETMKDNLFHQLEELVSFARADILMRKVITFEPSVSQYELLGQYTLYYERSEKVTILFPGRLSIGEERRTNWDKFVIAINELRKKRQDFEVIFTDPNNSMTDELKDGLKEWIFTIPKNRVQFINALAKSDVVVSLMDVEGFGGISIREALLYGCTPVIPEVHEYLKMAPENYPGFVGSPIYVSELVHALEWAIIKGKKERGNKFEEIGRKFSIEEQFKKLLPKLEEILND